MTRDLSFYSARTMIIPPFETTTVSNEDSD